MQQIVANIEKKYDVQSPSFRLAWLRLARTARIGARSFMDIMRFYGHPERAIVELQKRGSSLNIKPMSRNQYGSLRRQELPWELVSEQEAQTELSELAKTGATLLLACDAAYPESLRQIDDPPPVLTIMGERPNLLGSTQHRVAIVGSRNPSLNGLVFAKQLGKALSAHGYIVVSGLARGIDAAAHASSLASGTIAVVAGGADYIYPQENKHLFESIYKQGLVVSEHRLGQPPLSQSFPQRNRIISGLVSAVVVVEAAHKSGTLITARFALEQGREVYAVPGSPLDARYHGTNALIKGGAQVITGVEEFLADLDSSIKEGANGGIYQQALFDQKQVAFEVETPDFTVIKHDLEQADRGRELEDQKQRLLNLLSFSPSDFEDLLIELRIAPGILSWLLVELELAGLVLRGPDNSVVLAAEATIQD